VSNDDRADSLASQAASWVPPWERAPREPDRAYQAAAEEKARAEAERRAADEDAVDAELAEVELAAADGDAMDAELAAAGEDAAETVAVVGGGHEVPGVDSPAEAGSEPEPGLGELGPELAVPGAVEQAVVDEDADGQPADLPLPADGDDAGDVFDAAADDDLGDDADVDLAAGELVPGDDEDDDGEASAPGSAEAEPAGERGQVRAGSAVPEQGRRRRNGPGEVGDGSARTSEEAEPGAGRKVSGSAEPSAEPFNAAGSPAELDISDGPQLDAEAEVADLPALMDDAELAAALEAILLVVDEPVGEMQLAQILEQPTERVGAMLEDLSARYTGAGHGFDLRRAAGGWRLYTRPEYAAYVERFVLDGQSVRLTQAALETLAVVAYKQPVTRSRISAIRGVNCDGVMRTLVTRGLIEECGTEGETGAHLYRTTPLFLEKLGLNSVDQLPPLAPFLPDDVEEVLDASG
jgi:segregation and condensation protein B